MNISLTKSRVSLWFRSVIRHGLWLGSLNCLKILLGRTSSLKLPWTTGTIALRPGTSDLEVYKQVAVWQEYDIPVSFTPRCIVDLGANIGLSALFFSARYPDATVYAYEPQSENFELLLRNTRQNSQVFPVQRAVWGHRIPCEVRSTGTEHWAAKIAEAAPGGSRHTITVSEIIEDHELELIDILKIDIEGAERSVFTGDVSWLSRVRLVIIELHDFLEPGCAQAFFNALKDTPYTLEVVGENFVVRNRGLS